MNREQAMEKLAKLKRLADRGGTPAEAEAAQRKMQQLLEEFQLEMADIPDEDLGPMGAEDREFVNLDFDRDHSSRWKDALFYGLGNANFVRVIRSVRQRKHFAIGRRANVIMTREFYLYLAAEIERRAEKDYREQAEPGENKRSWKNTYCTIATNVVIDRAKEQFSKFWFPEPKTAREHELARRDTAIRETDKVERELAKYFPKLSNSGGGAAANNGGALAGLVAGQQIGLNQQVGTDDSRRRIGS